MKTRRRLSLALLIYWGLLINLGPSLHTLGFLGLHDHDDCCSASLCETQPDSHSHTHLGCGCDSHDHQLPDEDPQERSQLTSAHDCSFCEFFDQYQAMSSPVPLYEPGERFELISTQLFSLESTGTVCYHARGPPSLLCI